jgi:hypothetical protein
MPCRSARVAMAATVADRIAESSGETTGSAKGLTDELADLMERLLAALGERAARARAPALPGQALELVQCLLALLAGSGRSHEMRRLTGALEVVRDRLEPALPAEHELKAASVELEKVWAELSPAVTSRERFWDTV